MSADIKWETVESGTLKRGDAIRARAKGGTTWIPAMVEIYSTASESLRVHLDGAPHVSWLEIESWDFERAVPERKLPTEPGIYLNPDRPFDKFDSVFTLTTGANWVNDRSEDLDADGVPGNLVRLVPVTEVDELRKRIDAVRALVNSSATVSNGERRNFHAALDGEARNV